MIYEVGNLLDAHEGSTFVIVGKGPTELRYEDLGKMNNPFIFINDAVQLEGFAVRAAARFWFAHDAIQSIWATAPGISACVLPLADAYDSAGRPLISVAQVIDELGAHNEGTYDPSYELPRQILGYHWALDKWRRLGIQGLTEVTKHGLARSGELFLNSGTIHSAIHFAWLCGAHKIAFVGCDGIAEAGYDKRLALRGTPYAGRYYPKIRRVQDQMIEALGLQGQYLGTPKKE